MRVLLLLLLNRLTVQKKVFYLISLLSLIRVVFFIISLISWDYDTGEIVVNKVLFYTLDELSTLIFFTLACVLALFWAEIYYIAIDSVATFENILRPTINLLNVAALIAILLCCYLSSSSYIQQDGEYIFIQYSIIISIIYCIASILFAYYANRSEEQINQTPIFISTRKERSKALNIISNVFVIALIVRAILIFVMTGKNLKTHTLSEALLVLAYYFLLEIIPVCFAVLYYRVESYNIDGYEEEPARPWESAPLTNSGDSSSSRQLDPELETEDDVVKNLIFKLSANQ